MKNKKNSKLIKILTNEIEEKYIKLYPATGQDDILIYKQYANGKKNVIQLTIGENMDRSTIYRKINKVRNFIEKTNDDSLYIDEEIDMLKLSYWMPNEFIHSSRKCNNKGLSLIGNKVFSVTIAIFQNYTIDYIKRDQLIKLSSALKNKNQLLKLIQELEGLTIENISSKIKIYEEVFYENSGLHFRFTNDAIERIDNPFFSLLRREMH